MSDSSRTAKLGGREPFSPTFNSPEANTRFVLVDGSADTFKMSRLHALAAATAAPADQAIFAPSGDWEVPDTILGTGSLGVGRDGMENGDGSQLPVPGGVNKYPAFFWATRRGVQGRDIPR